MFKNFKWYRRYRGGIWYYIYTPHDYDHICFYWTQEIPRVLGWIMKEEDYYAKN